MQPGKLFSETNVFGHAEPNSAIKRHVHIGSGFRNAIELLGCETSRTKVEGNTAFQIHPDGREEYTLEAAVTSTIGVTRQLVCVELTINGKDVAQHLCATKEGDR